MRRSQLNENQSQPLVVQEERAILTVSFDSPAEFDESLRSFSSLSIPRERIIAEHRVNCQV